MSTKSAVVTCPECDCEFDVYADELGWDTDDVKEAAHNLLRKYQGGFSPSAGDIDRLKDRLIEILTTEFGIPRGSI